MPRATHSYRLRPASFRYNADIDPTNARTFGLIAEEVDKVMPELVVRDKNGVIQTVNYQLLPALLLNEIQRQQKRIDALEKRLSALEARQR